MNNKSVELITKWQTELTAANNLDYSPKKEVYKSIVEELAKHQNNFDGESIWDLTAVVSLIQDLVEFQLRNNIVFTGDEISESAAKILGHLPKKQI